MKIAMFTNTYLPHVGGVARSVKTLEDELRSLGHEVRVIAPESSEAVPSDDVLRIPAIQNFNGSDFSVRLPAPNLIREFMDDFDPDIIHSHHPFLLGDTAIRESWKTVTPVVFTHHTLYERYTHYVPLDSDALKRVAIQLATEYCNLCDHIIAPSESIAQLLQSRGVEVPVTPLPTGIDTRMFGQSSGIQMRQRLGIPEDAKVIGHVGRLAEEKNLLYLAEAAKEVQEQKKDVWFLLVGEGPEREKIQMLLKPDRTVATGSLQGQDLADAYAAMDLFLFSSQSETQGMVLAEAMAAGVAVMALDGPGVRDIVQDRINGRLLDGHATAEEYSRTVIEVLAEEKRLEQMREGALETAQKYDKSVTTRRVVELYENLLSKSEQEGRDLDPWDRLLSGIGTEWELTVAKLTAVAAVISETQATEAHLD